MTYREPGRAVDETEVETTRIREANARRFVSSEMRMKMRDARSERLWRWLSYDGAVLMIGIIGVGVFGGIVAIAVMYAHARFYR